MKHSIHQLLADCTVRIIAGDSSGTGFFVGQDMILTCTHVVASSANKEGIPPVIHVVYKGSQPINASLEKALPVSYPDLALLRVAIGEHPCVTLSDDVTLGDETFTWGFPTGYPNGDSVGFIIEGFTGRTSHSSS